MNEQKTFAIRTFGCQMNVHDSEKLSNLLLHEGYGPASEDDADLLVINTCSVREKAEHKLYTELGMLRDWKADRSGRIVGVGGCVAQQEGQTILKRFSHVDIVFGTHNLRSVPAMLKGAEAGNRGLRIDESSSLDRFDLPERHPGFRSSSQGQAFVTVMEGCDMFCSFCVVPRTRGREISRPAEQIVEEVERLVDSGVSEITLLGQTVNAYGRHDVRKGKTRETGTIPYAELLGRLDAIEGLHRIRYTSPHPIFFDDDLIAAHGELESLCPHVHLPVQSGSNAILEQMRRRYTREDYLVIVAALRASRPDLVLTSDMIVGFPGETDDDFRQTLSLMEEVGFVDSYSFKYSRRPGTKALEFEDCEVPEEVAKTRLSELQQLQRGMTLDYHFSRVGGSAQILVEGESRKGASQVRGRDLHHRVVNVEVGEGPIPATGSLLEVDVVEGTPHSLIGIPPGAVRTVAG
jgi:tRNA-2-methylthio-N6-dimethylallyladenosine synthase